MGYGLLEVKIEKRRLDYGFNASFGRDFGRGSDRGFFRRIRVVLELLAVKNGGDGEVFIGEERNKIFRKISTNDEMLLL